MLGKPSCKSLVVVPCSILFWPRTDLSCLSSNSCIITSGEAELIPNGFSTRIINYGDSICDCNYSVTLNGTEYFVVVN